MNYHAKKKVEKEKQETLKAYAKMRYERLIQKILRAENRNYYQGSIEIVGIIEPFDDPKDQEPTEVIFSFQEKDEKQYCYIYIKHEDGKRKYKMFPMHKGLFDSSRGMYFLKNR